jgi:hypothetical protein
MTWRRCRHGVSGNKPAAAGWPVHAALDFFKVSEHWPSHSHLKQPYLGLAKAGTWRPISSLSRNSMSKMEPGYQGIEAMDKGASLQQLAGEPVWSSVTCRFSLGNNGT